MLRTAAGPSGIAGIPPAKAKRPKIGTRPRLEYGRLRQANPRAVAVEPTGKADALGVVAAKTGMLTVHLFEAIDHRRLVEPA